MRGVRQIIVEEDMNHPLIGRPVLDEMGFVASQHLNIVRDKFHLHDFGHIGEELLETEKQPLGVLSKLLLKPADIPEFIEDLPDVLALAKKKNMKRREQMKPNALDEDQCELQRCEDEDEKHDVLHPNVKFASLKEQALFYDDIPDDDPIDRVQGLFQAQAWHRPSCECKAHCHQAARRCRTRANVSSQVRSAAAEAHA
jgi:hypothetical protein